LLRDRLPQPEMIALTKRGAAMSADRAVQVALATRGEPRASPG
jgi:hypothetical protein